MRHKLPYINGNTQEWFLLGSFVIDLVHFSIDSVYNLTHSYIGYSFMLISVFMIVFNYQIKLEKKPVLLFLFIILLSMCNLKLNGSGLGNIIHLFWPITIMFTYYNAKHDHNFFNWISLISKFFFYFLVLKAIFVYSRIDASSLSDIHDSGVINPNMVGLVIALLYFCCNFSIKQASWGKKLFRLGAACVGLLFCDSRGSLLALTAVILFSVLFKSLIRTRYSFLILVLLLIIALGSLFPIIYVSIYKSRLLGNTEIMGKQVFTGRQWIWMNIFDYMNKNKESYLFGTGYNTSFYVTADNRAGAFNPHNAYLMLFLLFGLPVVILYLGFIISIIKKAYKKGALSEIQIQAIWILMVIFITGFVEITLSFVPDLIFTGIALGILYDNKESSINVNTKSDSLLLVRALTKRRKGTTLH